MATGEVASLMRARKSLLEWIKKALLTLRAAAKEVYKCDMRWLSQDIVSEM